MRQAQPPGDAIRALARGRKRPSAPDRLAIAEHATRILILKPHDQLGDFVLATPTFRALRERYPQARLALLTREFLAPLAHRTKDVDRVWVLPRIADPSSLASFLKIVAAVIRFRPDTTFVLNSVSRSKSADALALLSGARLIVGRSRVFAGRPDEDAPADPGAAALEAGTTDPLYDLDVAVGRHALSQADRLLDLVRWCTTPAPSLEARLDLTAEDRQAGRRRLAEALPAAASPTTGRIVGLHPGAANELKCWPLESFVAFGADLVAVESSAGLRLVVFDSPRERGRAAAVVAGLAARGVTAGLVPASGIGEFASTCSALDLLACNDSGVMHIAAAVGVPTVSFHSLGNPIEWAPRSDRSIAFHAPKGIAAIPVTAAVEAARTLLALDDRSPPTSAP